MRRAGPAQSDCHSQARTARHEMLHRKYVQKYCTGILQGDRPPLHIESASCVAPEMRRAMTGRVIGCRWYRRHTMLSPMHSESSSDRISELVQLAQRGLLNRRSFLTLAMALR